MSLIAEASADRSAASSKVAPTVKVQPTHSATRMSAVAKQIQHKPLPIFKQTLQTVQLCQQRINVPMVRIINALMLDPCYMKAIFSEVNTRRLSGKNKAVDSIGHAISLIGVPRVVEIGQSLPSFSSIRDPRVKAKLNQIFMRSYHAGVQARELIIEHEKGSAQTAFVNAQLRDIYQIALWVHAPNEMLSLLQEKQQIEQTELNELLLSAGKVLIHQWQQPLPMQHSFALKPDADRLVRTIDFANQLASYTEHSWYSRPLTHLIQVSAEGLGFSAAELSQRVRQNALIAARECRHYRGQAAACRLIQLPSKATAKTPLKAPKIKKKASNLQQRMDDLRDLGRQTRNAAQVIQFSFEMIKQLAPKQAMIFFIIDSRRSCLKSRFINNHDRVEQGLEIRLIKRSFFKALLKKSQSIWVRDENRKQFEELLKSQTPLQLNDKEFIAASLLIGDKPIGVFYLEGTSERPICAALYQQFERISKATVSVLEEMNENAN